MQSDIIEFFKINIKQIEATKVHKFRLQTEVLVTSRFWIFQNLVFWKLVWNKLEKLGSTLNAKHFLNFKDSNKTFSMWYENFCLTRGG